MAAFGGNTSLLSRQSQSPGLMTRLASKGKWLSTTGLLGMFLNFAPYLPASANSNNRLSEEELYEKAVNNPEVNEKLEVVAYERVREMAMPDTIASEVKSVSPMGGSFQDLRLSSKVGYRTVEELDGEEETFHNGIDLGIKGKFKKGMIDQKVKAVQKAVVKKTGITGRGNVGYIDLSSVDGGYHWRYGHVYTLVELEKSNKSGVLNPKTGKVYAIGDTVEAGDAFTMVRAVRKGERSTAPHLHLTGYKNNKLLSKSMNTLVRKAGVLEAAVLGESAFSKQIGWYAAQGLLQKKTIEEMRTKVLEDNQRIYGADQSSRGMILFMINSIEGGYNPADGGTMYGITRNSHNRDLQKLGIKSIRHLKKTQALRIYQDKYWNVMDLDQYAGSPAFQLAALDAAIQQGTGRRTQEMIAKANGSTEALIELRKGFLEANKIVDRERRMGLVELHAEKLESPAPLKGAYEFRNNKLNVVATVISEEKKKEFIETIRQEDKAIEGDLQKAELLAAIKENLPVNSTKDQKQELNKQLVAIIREEQGFVAADKTLDGGKDPEPEEVAPKAISYAETKKEVTEKNTVNSPMFRPGASSSSWGSALKWSYSLR